MVAANAIPFEKLFYGSYSLCTLILLYLQDGSDWKAAIVRECKKTISELAG